MNSLPSDILYFIYSYIKCCHKVFKPKQELTANKLITHSTGNLINFRHLTVCQTCSINIDLINAIEQLNTINSSTKTIHFNTSKALNIAYPYLHQLFNFAPAHICCGGKGYMLDDLPNILQKYRTYTTKYRTKTNIL